MNKGADFCTFIFLLSTLRFLIGSQATDKGDW